MVVCCSPVCDGDHGAVSELLCDGALNVGVRLKVNIGSGLVNTDDL